MNPRSPAFRRLPQHVQNEILDRELRVQQRIAEGLRQQWRGVRRRPVQSQCNSLPGVANPCPSTSAETE